MDLEKRVEELEQLFSMALDLICIADIHTTVFLKVNQAFTKILGFSEEEFIGKSFLDFVHPEDVDPTRSVVKQKLLRGYPVFHFENRYRCKDGTYRWLSWVSHPNIEKGTTYAVARDITERKKVEKALREREDRFDNVLKTIPDMVSIHDTEMNIIYSNWNGFAAIPEDKRILNTKCYATYRGYDDICPDCQAKAVIQKKQPVQTEIKLPDEKWFDVRVLPIMNEHGDCHLFVEWVRDITERKHSEELVRKSEEQLKAIFEAGPDPLVVYDDTGCPQYLNPSFTRTFGWTLGELQGKRIPFVPENEQEKTTAKITELYRSGKPSRFLTQRLTKQNKPIDVHVSAALIKGSDEKGAGMVVNLTDISEQKKLQKQLQKAQKMEAIGTLAGGIAHDFNNMLNVILGHSELALTRTELPQPTYSNLKQIHDAALRSAELTRQLLGFARRQTAVPEVLDINHTISGMLNMLRRLIGENIDLVWIPGQKLRCVKIDPAQIDQILVNLCVNARDAIDDVGTITIETRQEILDETYCAKHEGFVPGHYTIISVSDDGQGMIKETIEQIFDPFFTTKQVGEGTGLGLATVYGIVKQNNGFINVYSEPKFGSTFTIYLPGTNEATAVKEKSGTRKTAEVTETILVVEDEESILDLSKTILEQSGYKVFTASTPTQAIEIIKSANEPIHLLITDVIMPEMSGMELKDRLVRLYPDIRVLFISGYTSDVITHRGVLEKDVHFLQKPFSIDSLSQKVRDALDANSGAHSQ